jgi:4-amino-4-deoxy-L-arabinose transferase-like glycosyltransferase
LAVRQLAWILIVGSIVRGVLVWSFGAQPPAIDDARDYDRLARGLVETGRYVDEQGKLTSIRPPLFPAMAAGVYRVFGKGNYRAVAAVQAAVSLLTVVLVFRLGAELYSPRIGVIAAAATCFYPTLLAFNQLFLSEVLFTFFVCAGTLASVRLMKSASLPAAGALGLCLGLGALTRSVLWLFAPLLCAGLAAFGAARFGQRVAAAAVTLAVFAALIAPWAWRNTQVQKTLTFVDVMGGRNVMMGNYEHTPLDRSWATITDVTGERAWNNVLGRQTPNYTSLTQGEIDKLAMKYGVTYFLSHPWQSLQRSTVKSFNFWQLEREVVAGMRQGMFGHAPTIVMLVVALVVCGAYAAGVFGGIFGALVVPPRDRANHLLVLSWIAFPWALHSVAFAHSRYHLPLMPLVLIYAAAAFASCGMIVERSRSWAFAAACTACFLLAGSWVREFLLVDLKWFV